MKREITNAFASLMLVLVLAAVTASAQSAKQMTANIPFQFTIGNQTLPAGEYTIRYINQDSGKNTLLIKSTDGRNSRIVQMTPAQKSTPAEKASLVFNQYGDSYFLSEVWNAADQFGLSLPKSRAERELERRLAQEESKRMDVARTERKRVTVALITRR